MREVHNILGGIPGERLIQPHIPTSAALLLLLEKAPAHRVDFAWLIRHLEKRSFGLLMLFMSLFGLAPGIASIGGFLLAYPAIQMILGYKSPYLPRFLAIRSISTPFFARWVVRFIPLLRRMELFIRPRWHTPFQTTKRFVGLIILLLSITLFLPFPFNIIPTLVIMLMSLAYLEEDGVLLAISLAAAVLSFAVTAGIIWASMRATDLIGGFWMGVP